MRGSNGKEKRGNMKKGRQNKEKESKLKERRERESNDADAKDKEIEGQRRKEIYLLLYLSVHWYLLASRKGLLSNLLAATQSHK